jgi:putative endonuclease
MPTGYVYIITNSYNKVLYIGVTSDIKKRIWQHRQRFHPDSFSAKYNLNKLVYFEILNRIDDAIRREKQLKSRSRNYKIVLIESMNPTWKDLYFTLP